MAFNAYTGSFNFTVADNAQAAAPSSSLPFGTPTNQTSITSKTSFTLGTAANEVNQAASNILTMTAGSTATINLQSLTNTLGTTGVSLTKLKRYVFWLLTPIDDATAGSSASSVTIGNAATNPNKLNMGSTTMTFILTGGSTVSGDKQPYVTSSAAGLTVSTTACNVLVTNNDGGNAAALFYNLAGN